MLWRASPCASRRASFYTRVSLSASMAASCCWDRAALATSASTFLRSAATCSLASLAFCLAVALCASRSPLERVSSTSSPRAHASMLDAWVEATFSRKPRLAMYFSSQPNLEYS